ncbi:MAG: hypothetical protein R3B54_00800 [Bdellovibrionota bacterium]
MVKQPKRPGTGSKDKLLGLRFVESIPRTIQAVPHESGSGYRYLLAPVPVVKKKGCLNLPKRSRSFAGMDLQ